MMEYAKAHYFDGINESLYQDAEHVTGNLHAFREFYFDQNQKPVWVYDIQNETGKGISRIPGKWRAQDITNLRARIHRSFVMTICW